MIRQHFDSQWHPDLTTDTLVGDLDHALRLDIEDALEAARIPFDRFRTPMVEWGDVTYDRRVFRPRPDDDHPLWDFSIPVTAHNEPVLLISQWDQIAKQGAATLADVEKFLGLSVPSVGEWWHSHRVPIRRIDASPD